SAYRSMYTDSLHDALPIFNPDLQWEGNRKFEAALDIELLNGNIQASAAFYLNRSGNQLLPYPLPPNTGYTSIQMNLPAVIQNSRSEEHTSELQSRENLVCR